METPSPAGAATRRVLVTGASGQDGRYLCEALVAQGALVFGLLPADQQAAVAHPMARGVRFLDGDLRDAASLRLALEAAEPDEVYNLAAITFVPSSWRDPGEIFDINTLGVARLLVAIRDCRAPIRLCQASTAEIFGAASGLPQDETTALRPANPYGVSKAQAHRLVARARDEYGLFACSAILFNHESPLRQPQFVTRKITLAAARIARGLDRELVLGDLDAARDWGYAPEYMNALRLMLGAAQPRDYVVASGRSASVRDFAALAFAHVGLDWRRYVRSDSALSRSADGAARIGNAARIQNELGWKAHTTLEQLVATMVDADLARIDVG